MGRVRFSVLLLVVLGVAVPSGAASTSETGCSASVPSGGSATCVQSFRIPHFNADDAIDYETLVARIVSPSADSWRVAGRIQDARGKLYFAWECSARRSTITGASETYVDRSCAASRKVVKSSRNGRTSYTYYRADTSKPQRLTVTAWVGRCAPSCRFEGKATYLFAG